MLYQPVSCSRWCETLKRRREKRTRFQLWIDRMWDGHAWMNFPAITRVALEAIGDSENTPADTASVLVATFSWQHSRGYVAQLQAHPLHQQSVTLTCVPCIVRPKHWDSMAFLCNCLRESVEQ